LEIPEGMGYEQQNFLFRHLPEKLEDMSRFKRLLKELKSEACVTELSKEVTFDEFWKRYFAGRGSDNSSKKKACARWERMSKAQRVKAYEHIPKYLNRIPSGVGIKLCETYLNSDIWNG
jgi:hypothetical protein